MSIKGTLPEIIKNTGGWYEGDLIHYFRAVFGHATNLNNPYHNFRHMAHVLWLCHQACIFYSATISASERRNLLIAALFHDFDHTGKSGPDWANIELAVEGLKRHLAPEDKSSFDRLEKLIRATEYPHSVDSAPGQGILGLIIRDADVSQSLEPAWLQQVVFGLAAEQEVEPLEMLKRQIDFLGSIEFNSRWAQVRYPKEFISEKISEAGELINILTS